MKDIYELWLPAPHVNELPEVPPLGEFELCDEKIDVGYDMFLSDAYVAGPYALKYDEEQFGRDTWGWSAQIRYIGGGVVRVMEAAGKCGSPREAHEALVNFVSGMRS